MTMERLVAKFVKAMLAAGIKVGISYCEEETDRINGFWDEADFHDHRPYMTKLHITFTYENGAKRDYVYGNSHTEYSDLVDNVEDILIDEMIASRVAYASKVKDIEKSIEYCRSFKPDPDDIFGTPIDEQIKHNAESLKEWLAAYDNIKNFVIVEG